MHIISGLSSTQTLLEVSNVSQTPINSASTAGVSQGAKRHHHFEALDSEKTASANNNEEYNLPGKEGLHALAEEMRRLADVNMTGVAVSLAAFVSCYVLLASHAVAEATFILRYSFPCCHQLPLPLSFTISHLWPDSYLHQREHCMLRRRPVDSLASVAPQWRMEADEVALGSSLPVQELSIMILGERARVLLVGSLLPRGSIKHCYRSMMVGSRFYPCNVSSTR